MKTKYKIRNGFTLMELMVVIAIIALLAGIMTPNVARRLERAKMTRAEADIAAIESAIAMYENDIGRYPPGGINNLRDWLTGTGSADVNVPAANKWSGPYIKGIETDPWGKGYTYLKNGDPKALPPTYPTQTPGIDYPLAGDGGCIAPPHNLSYYIYSTGKDKLTASTGDTNGYDDDATDGDDNDDDINNWDVNKSWQSEY